MAKNDRKFIMNIFDDITLIIVTYNSDNLIKKNLDVLKKFKTIIVDNSNNSKIVSIIEDFKNIKYFKMNSNIGYGKANNFGISKCDTELVLVVNPDIILNIKSILNLFENYMLYLNENIGLVAPSLYDNFQNRRTNGTISFLKKNNKYKLNNSENNLIVGNTCCDFIVGCCFLINRKYFNKIGGFDENFFMYFEDNDLCDKIRNDKKSIIEITSAKFVHLQNSSYQKNFLIDIKLSLLHKISECIYLKKNLSLSNFYKNIFLQSLDYFQRLIFNFITFRFNKSLKNLLRLISILLFVTSLYKMIT